ncbi:hypothetical protein [Faecalicatena orotica]|uniref:Uncharacterized protein n=1 Tax=Faecalicatena orotica TaxID=1544 RepID=A0A2Y9BL82_9FIRM|nr:hypothetical protein [Faecalicatena orotica]PWJ28730.1 hypothetical protein A8806_108245 [Faecalicatena orotica]SSA56552.1 hypothetical protein SAMN05216536_108245 [Faecalicatena orotica]
MTEHEKLEAELAVTVPYFRRYSILHGSPVTAIGFLHRLGLSGDI